MVTAGVCFTFLLTYTCSYYLSLSLAPTPSHFHSMSSVLTDHLPLPLSKPFFDDPRRLHERNPPPPIHHLLHLCKRASYMRFLHLVVVVLFLRLESLLHPQRFKPFFNTPRRIGSLRLYPVPNPSKRARDTGGRNIRRRRGVRNRFRVFLFQQLRSY